MINDNAALQVVERRLRSQRLVAAPLANPAAVVQWLGAVQSQEYPGAAWGVAQRASGVTQATVDAAYAAGGILRTHVMRPTWHFIHPADIRWLLALTSPRVHTMNGTFYRKLELSADVLARGHQVLGTALRDGAHQTRDELAAALVQAGVVRAEDDRLRLTYLVMHAELEGLICSGAMRGKQHTYALLEERVPPAPARTREEALAELVRRYFTSHGPATIRDFTWWSGLTAADAKTGLALNPALESAVVAGQTLWFAPDTPPAPDPAPVAHLLPAYDEYTVAYKNHDAILAAEYRDRVIAAFGIVIVIDGRIVGAWKRVHARASVQLSLTPFRALTGPERHAVAQAIERYGAFLEKRIELVETIP